MSDNFIDFKEQYEVSKTLRFSLSQHQENSDIKKNRTHQEFLDLVKESFKRVKNSAEEKSKENNAIENTEDFIQKIRNYVNENENQLKLWKVVSKRPDVIKIKKEYLKVLSKKAKFDFNKSKSSVIALNGMIDKKTKKPNDNTIVVTIIARPVVSSVILIALFTLL